MTTTPDAKGFFGDHGGSFLPPALVPVMEELTRAFERYRDDPEFIREYEYYQRHFTGRPRRCTSAPT